jgi:quercetin dioxygenase-like cupin family protein
MSAIVPGRGASAALICVLLTFGASTVWVGHARQAPAQPVLAEASGFTGRTATLDTTGYSIGRRVFEAGAHNATWHTHTAGQLIFAEAGHGRFQIKGQPIHELAPGESGFIPGGMMHWHGAVPNENFTMTFITMGASTTTQGDPLSDDVYLGKAK